MAEPSPLALSPFIYREFTAEQWLSDSPPLTDEIRLMDENGCKLVVDPAPPVPAEIRYGGDPNWRRVLPIAMVYGSSKYHTEPGWIMVAFEVEDGHSVLKTFAMNGIHGWRPVPPHEDDPDEPEYPDDLLDLDDLEAAL